MSGYGCDMSTSIPVQVVLSPESDGIAALIEMDGLCFGDFAYGVDVLTKGVCLNDLVTNL